MKVDEFLGWHDSASIVEFRDTGLAAMRVMKLHGYPDERRSSQRLMNALLHREEERIESLPRFSDLAEADPWQPAVVAAVREVGVGVGHLVSGWMVGAWCWLHENDPLDLSGGARDQRGVDVQDSWQVVRRVPSIVARKASAFRGETRISRDGLGVTVPPDLSAWPMEELRAWFGTLNLSWVRPGSSS